MKIINSADEVKANLPTCSCHKARASRKPGSPVRSKRIPTVCPICHNTREVAANPSDEVGAQIFIPCPDCCA